MIDGANDGIKDELITEEVKNHLNEDLRLDKLDKVYVQLRKIKLIY